ncbi:hypothetical protein AT05_11730 [Schleiferia thermophila str. Yellowstone]|uniref:RHS repeat domain-containing protein n=1 Tax=Schleiferia thermophila TaxID=884107 RepID=UPI0004E61FA2|nr:RHS repeat-associated core domain-containing protein [Schleiferia thermophila]KFD38111.1 hypothetical protein AT05_11730 [Schleiferia thermophila str. Yellowstone]
MRVSAIARTNQQYKVLFVSRGAQGMGHPGHVEYVTDGAGVPYQYFHYSPWGEILISQTRTPNSTDFSTPYRFNAKELDPESGLFYYGARYYHPVVSKWLSVDPMADKYPSLSAYNYCAWNPVMLVDPDGRVVIAADEQSQTNIKLSLTKEEAKYVKFDKNGVLDTKKLNKSKSTSDNMKALKELAKSDTKYRFSVAEKDLDGAAFYDKGDGRNFYHGVTHLPNNVDKPSPDNDVHIITWSGLSQERQVENMAHEAYGHAYFFEFSKSDPTINPNHTREAVLGLDGICCDFVKTNDALEQQIERVTKEAKQNIQGRKK